MPKRKSIPRRKRSSSRRRSARRSQSARRRRSARRSNSTRRRSTRRSRTRAKSARRSQKVQQKDLIKWFKETYPSYRLSWQVKAALNGDIIHITKGDIKKAVNVTLSKNLKTLQLKHFSKVSPHQISLVTTRHYASETRPSEPRPRGATLENLKEIS